MSPTFALLFLFILPSAHAAIFGSDDRSYLTPDSPYAELGRATAVAVLNGNLVPSEALGGTYRLRAEPLSQMMCENEKFANDPSLSYSCSGFLVAPDLLVTAGHCQVNVGVSQNETGMYCAAFGWLFDYQRDANGAVNRDEISPDKYVRCKRIIYAVREEHPPYRDFALVQLEHPMPGRKPFRIASAPVKAGDPVEMIGFPFGTPMKLSTNARVSRNDAARNSFLTTLDAFEGNSGSVVFNRDHEVVGILVAGTPSMNTWTDQGNGCERYNRCDENGEHCALPDENTSVFPGYQGVGSEVERIAPIQELLKHLP